MGISIFLFFSLVNSSISICCRHRGLAMSTSAPTEEQEKGVRRFDGVDKDGKKCKRWVRWAKSYLRSSTIAKEEWGNKLLTLLDGAAERTCEKYDPDAIGYSGSHLEIFKTLMERFPEREETDDEEEELEPSGKTGCCTGKLSTRFAVAGATVLSNDRGPPDPVVLLP